MTLVDQTVLRAPDGTRWVVSTQALGRAFVTTARKTGCDLRPAASVDSPTREQARAAHQRYATAIKDAGAP